MCHPEGGTTEGSAFQRKFHIPRLVTSEAATIVASRRQFRNRLLFLGSQEEVVRDLAGMRQHRVVASVQFRVAAAEALGGASLVSLGRC